MSDNLFVKFLKKFKVTTFEKQKVKGQGQCPKLHLTSKQKKNWDHILDLSKFFIKIYEWALSEQKKLRY